MDIKSFLLIGGIITLLAAAIENYRPFVEWQVKTSNAFRGLKTEITEKTFTAHRMQSIIVALVGLFTIFTALTLF